MLEDMVYMMKKSYKLLESILMVDVEVLTDAEPINQSSNPKAFTILIRTKHLNEKAATAVTRKTMFTPRSSGPRFGIDMLANDQGKWKTGEPKKFPVGSPSLHAHAAVDLDSG